MTVRRCAVCKRPFPPMHLGRSTQQGRWYCSPDCFFPHDSFRKDWQAEVAACRCTTCAQKRTETAK